jgi:hypothetical protein
VRKLGSELRQERLEKDTMIATLNSPIRRVARTPATSTTTATAAATPARGRTGSQDPSLLGQSLTT